MVVIQNNTKASFSVDDLRQVKSTVQQAVFMIATGNSRSLGKYESSFFTSTKEARWIPTNPNVANINKSALKPLLLGMHYDKKQMSTALSEFVKQKVQSGQEYTGAV